MKIKKVSLNNRKKAFIVEAGKKSYEFPFAELDTKPTKSDPVSELYVDPDAACEAFTYRLKSGKEDTILFDQVLYVNRDPDFMRNHLLFELSCKAQEEFKASGLTKQALARRLDIPTAQLYRLLDQAFYGKTIDQMVRVMAALGCDIEMKTKAAA